MRSDYDSLEKAADAQAFARTRFGKHYVARLTQLRDDALKVSMDISYTDSFRAHKATQAAVYEQEITYFQIAQTIQENKGILQKVRARLDARKEAQVKDV